MAHHDLRILSYERIEEVLGQVALMVHAGLHKGGSTAHGSRGSSKERSISQSLHTREGGTLSSSVKEIPASEYGMYSSPIVSDVLCEGAESARAHRTHLVEHRAPQHLESVRCRDSNSAVELCVSRWNNAGRRLVVP